MYNKYFLKFASSLFDSYYPAYRLFYFSYKMLKDKEEIKLFRRIIKNGDIVLDIGANIGFYSVMFSELVGKKGKVHAFEPERSNYKHLRKGSFNYKNIKTYNKAVTSDDKGIRLYISNILNVDNRTYKMDNSTKNYNVGSLKVDSLLKTKINFVKIDIQGGELAALRGMRQTIKKNKNIIIYMEYWPKAQREQDIKFKDFYKFFLENKLNPYIYENKKFKKISKDFGKRYENYKDYDFDNWIISRNKNLLEN